MNNDDTNYNEITCFKEHKSCADGLQMLAAAISLNDRNEGNPFSEDYVPDEDDINAADPFNNMDSDGEDFEIDIV